MAKIQMIHSDPENWNLIYQEHEPIQETPLTRLGSVILSVVAWPLMAVVGTVFLIDSSIRYYRSFLRERKITNILSDESALRDYALIRIKKCQDQIQELKRTARAHLKDLNNSFSLPIPGFWEAARDKGWENFPWDKFLITRFTLAKEDADYSAAQLLEQCRTRINFLIEQKNLLEKEGNEIRIGISKRISEFSLVKNQLLRHEARDMLRTSWVFLFPLLPIFIKGTARLPDPALIEKHNQMVNSHSFLVPYIKI